MKRKSSSRHISLPHPDTVLLAEAVSLLERCLKWYETGGTMPRRVIITSFLRGYYNDTYYREEE